MAPQEPRDGAVEYLEAQLERYGSRSLSRARNRVVEEKFTLLQPVPSALQEAGMVAEMIPQASGDQGMDIVSMEDNDQAHALFARPNFRAPSPENLFGLGPGVRPKSSRTSRMGSNSPEAQRNPPTLLSRSQRPKLAESQPGKKEQSQRNICSQQQPAAKSKAKAKPKAWASPRLQSREATAQPPATLTSNFSPSTSPPHPMPPPMATMTAAFASAVAAATAAISAVPGQGAATRTLSGEGFSLPVTAGYDAPSSSSTWSAISSIATSPPEGDQQQLQQPPQFRSTTNPKSSSSSSANTSSGERSHNAAVRSTTQDSNSGRGSGSGCVPPPKTRDNEHTHQQCRQKQDQSQQQKQQQEQQHQLQQQQQQQQQQKLRQQTRELCLGASVTGISSSTHSLRGPSSARSRTEAQPCSPWGSPVLQKRPISPLPVATAVDPAAPRAPTLFGGSNPLSRSTVQMQQQQQQLQQLQQLQHIMPTHQQQLRSPSSTQPQMSQSPPVATLAESNFFGRKVSLDGSVASEGHGRAAAAAATAVLAQPSSRENSSALFPSTRVRPELQSPSFPSRASNAAATVALAATALSSGQPSPRQAWDPATAPKGTAFAAAATAVPVTGASLSSTMHDLQASAQYQKSLGDSWASAQAPVHPPTRAPQHYHHQQHPIPCLEQQESRQQQQKAQQEQQQQQQQQRQQHPAHRLQEGSRETVEQPRSVHQASSWQPPLRPPPSPTSQGRSLCSSLNTQPCTAKPPVVGSVQGVQRAAGTSSLPRPQWLPNEEPQQQPEPNSRASHHRLPQKAEGQASPDPPGQQIHQQSQAHSQPQWQQSSSPTEQSLHQQRRQHPHYHLQTQYQSPQQHLRQQQQQQQQQQQSPQQQPRPPVKEGTASNVNAATPRTPMPSVLQWLGPAPSPSPSPSPALQSLGGAATVTGRSPSPLLRSPRDFMPTMPAGQVAGTPAYLGMGAPVQQKVVSSPQVHHRDFSGRTRPAWEGMGSPVLAARSTGGAGARPPLPAMPCMPCSPNNGNPRQQQMMSPLPSSSPIFAAPAPLMATITGGKPLSGSQMGSPLQEHRGITSSSGFAWQAMVAAPPLPTLSTSLRAI